MNTHAYYSNIPQPIPLLVFRATDLDPGISAVYRWENKGILGATHDLTVASNNIAPAYFASGGYKDNPYVRFSFSDMLQTMSALPESVCSSKPRVLLARVFIEAGTNSGNNRNLFGYGEYQSGQYARVLDFTITNSEEYVIHKYYRGTNSGQAITRGSWQWIGIVAGLPDASYGYGDGLSASTLTAAIYSEYIFCDPTEGPRTNRRFDLNTAPTPLRLGGGAYDGWNSVGTPFLLDCFYLFELLTESQKEAAKRQ